METVKELLELLSQTPETALWGLGLYFLFILIKLSSWILAIKLIASQFIKRFFDYKDISLSSKKGTEIAQYFENKKITNVDYTIILELLNTIKNGGSYIHESDIRDAITAIKKTKQ